MEAIVQGRLIKILDPVSGESANGQWKRQDFIIETNAQYPRKICFTVNNDRIPTADLQVGDSITVSLNIESREYNGRWMTNFRAWKIEKGLVGEAKQIELTGKVIQALEKREGTSAKGAWSVQEFVIELFEQYAPRVCFSVWNGRIHDTTLANGNNVTITVDIESREGTKGGWFSSVQAWRGNIAPAANTGGYGVASPSPAATAATVQQAQDIESLTATPSAPASSEPTSTDPFAGGTPSDSTSDLPF
ncbi:MAG: DUF3127 domain-containing protein [Bacteroidales bacterium]|nr:DUF3127 domain-containing protein [Bacteroidales bacterium]